MRTRMSSKTGATRRIALSDKTLTSMHKGTADEIGGVR